MRQIDPDVVPVYPITPQTPIIQAFAQFVADGRASGELVDVESEHSAMSAAIGSALAGARTMTATSSQGLALMAEVVYIAAAMRAPIVCALGNRALLGLINIHCDHSDSMLIRDSGVVQLFVENAQEAYDATILATRLAEHPDVLLPVFVCLDGFTITHSAEPVELLDDEDVRRFVGHYQIPFPLLGALGGHEPRSRSRCPTTTSSSSSSRWPRCPPQRTCWTTSWTSSRLHRAPLRAAETLPPGRRGAGDRADGLVCGHRQGRGRRAARPPPARGAAADRRLQAVSGAVGPRGARRGPDIAVLDRADSPGVAPLFAEIAAAVHGSRARVRSVVYGLGGRELRGGHRGIFDRCTCAPTGLRPTSG